MSKLENLSIEELKKKLQELEQESDWLEESWYPIRIELDTVNEIWEPIDKKHNKLIRENDNYIYRGRSIDYQIVEIKEIIKNKESESE